MKKWFAKALIPLTLLVAAGVVVMVIRTRKPDDQGPDERKIGYQMADLSPEMPPSGRLDPRFALLGAWQRAAVPKVSEVAVGGGAGSVGAAPGEVVLAAADGLVVFAGMAAEGGERAVLLAHRGPDGKEFQSVYAGLGKVDTAVGLLVARGARLGSAGKGGCRTGWRQADEVHPSVPHGGGGEAALSAVTINPAAALAPSALEVAMRPEDDPWSRVKADDPKAAERLLEIIGKEQPEEP